jgi:hypothetical protein
MGFNQLEQAFTVFEGVFPMVINNMDRMEQVAK